MMNCRTLHVLKTPVSEVGFGTWGLGGDAYGPISRPDALGLLRKSLESGITFYDTADLYGAGRAEELLGEAFESRRKSVTIATKVGFLPGGKTQDFSARHVRDSIEGSLKRLRTDHVDLYQLHGPALTTLDDASLLRELEDIQKSGKARAIGISVRSPADAAPAIEKYGFRCVQVNFNMIDQRPLDVGLFELAKKQQVGIIARTPFCFGFLTGRYSGAGSLGELDHRASRPPELIERWSQAPEYFKSIYAAGARTPLEVALQYCLAFREVSTVIPGMMNVQQLLENIGASDSSKRLSENDLAAIRAVYQQHFSAPQR